MTILSPARRMRRPDLLYRLYRSIPLRRNSKQTNAIAQYITVKAAIAVENIIMINAAAAVAAASAAATASVVSTTSGLAEI